MKREKKRKIKEGPEKRSTIIFSILIATGYFFISAPFSAAKDPDNFIIYYKVIDSEVVKDSTQLTLDLHVSNQSGRALKDVRIMMIDTVDYDEHGEVVLNNLNVPGIEVLRGKFDRPAKLFGNFQGYETLYLKVNFVGADGAFKTEIVTSNPFSDVISIPVGKKKKVVVSRGTPSKKNPRDIRKRAVRNKRSKVFKRTPKMEISLDEEYTGNDVNYSDNEYTPDNENGLNIEYAVSTQDTRSFSNYRRGFRRTIYQKSNTDVVFTQGAKNSPSFSNFEMNTDKVFESPSYANFGVEMAQGSGTM